MTKQNKTVEKAQGANTTTENEETNVPSETEPGFMEHLEKVITEGLKEEAQEEKKTRAKMGRSTIYLLKAFKEYINKLATNKVITAEEVTIMRNIQKTATERWIGLEMDME